MNAASMRQSFDRQTDRQTDRHAERNYGIDLLRIVSMAMICMLHILGHGGILSNCEKFSATYAISWFLEAAAYVAVNCYAMISGFVGVMSKRHKYTNIIMLWLQVFVVCVIYAVSFFIAIPGSVGVKGIIKSFFPVAFTQYWYFTAYFLLFFTMPMLNCILKNFTRKRMRNILAVLFILLSVFPTCFHRDIFITGSGYSALWLMVLYLAGGYIRLYNPLGNVKKRNLVLAYLCLTILTWCPKFVVELLTLKVFDKACGGDLFYSYISPTVLLASVALVVLFSRIQIRRTKIISILASVSFGVYIIHENSIVRPYILTDKFVSFASYHWLVLPLAVIGTAVVFYAVCGMLEYTRIKIFDALNIKNKILNIETKVIEKFSKQ